MIFKKILNFIWLTTLTFVFGISGYYLGTRNTHVEIVILPASAQTKATADTAAPVPVKNTTKQVAAKTVVQSSQPVQPAPAAVQPAQPQQPIQQINQPFVVTPVQTPAQVQAPNSNPIPILTPASAPTTKAS